MHQYYKVIFYLRFHFGDFFLKGYPKSRKRLGNKFAGKKYFVTNRKFLRIFTQFFENLALI